MPTVDGAGVPSLGYGWVLLRMFAALAVVSGVAYVALRYGLRRFGRSASPGRLLRVVEQCPLGPGRSVWVVEAAGRYLVVGSADGALSLLTELEPSSVEGRLAPPVTPRRTFAEFLGRHREPPGSVPS
ncbi:MAG: flagellar biosynthetic protein FliO [Deltaproteobacteria bacterium]|nr:flagellar biosynthetic protein FliO [Deltaproteobacteria bacterium]